MGSIDENLSHWTHYSWPQGGDEWSEVWGGADLQWWGALYPRLLGFFPTGCILEIAPGFGRFTRFLLDQCDRLIGVELTARCVEACRQRFAGRAAEFHLNDGLTLPMVRDGSVDFAISFDSLVHAEVDVLRSYIGELGRKLAADGAAFIHHSNVDAFRDPETGAIPIDNRHWRAESCSAKLVRESCDEHGLRCIVQEIVNWGGSDLTDVFSLFTRRGSRWDRTPVIKENPGFMAEAQSLGAISDLYPRS